MLMHYFEVFEFKFAFELICLLPFKNRKPFFLLLLHSLYSSLFLFEPKTFKVRSRPS
jgi:hypothetical protein